MHYIHYLWLETGHAHAQRCMPREGFAIDRREKQVGDSNL
jgi:hypothetical protein